MAVDVEGAGQRKAGNPLRCSYSKARQDPGPVQEGGTARPEQGTDTGTPGVPCNCCASSWSCRAWIRRIFPMTLPHLPCPSSG